MAHSALHLAIRLLNNPGRAQRFNKINIKNKLPESEKVLTDDEEKS